MGLFDGLRERLGALRAPPEVEAATLADVDTVRRAIRAEADRLGPGRRISVTMLMEHSGEDLRRVDLLQIIAHLDAAGEVGNVEQDSFGNLRFEVGVLGDGGVSGGSAGTGN